MQDLRFLLLIKKSVSALHGFTAPHSSHLTSLSPWLAWVLSARQLLGPSVHTVRDPPLAPHQKEVDCSSEHELIITGNTGKQGMFVFPGDSLTTLDKYSSPTGCLLQVFIPAPPHANFLPKRQSEPKAIHWVPSNSQNKEDTCKHSVMTVVIL